MYSCDLAVRTILILIMWVVRACSVVNPKAKNKVERMRGMVKSLCVVLGLLLLSVACGAKRLWGVDVGKKEEVP